MQHLTSYFWAIHTFFKAHIFTVLNSVIAVAITIPLFPVLGWWAPLLASLIGAAVAAAIYVAVTDLQEPAPLGTPGNPHPQSELCEPGADTDKDADVTALKFYVAKNRAGNGGITAQLGTSPDIIARDANGTPIVADMKTIPAHVHTTVPLDLELGRYLRGSRVFKQAYRRPDSDPAVSVADLETSMKAVRAADFVISAREAPHVESVDFPDAWAPFLNAVSGTEAVIPAKGGTGTTRAAVDTQVSKDGLMCDTCDGNGVIRCGFVSAQCGDCHGYGCHPAWYR